MVECMKTPGYQHELENNEGRIMQTNEVVAIFIDGSNFYKVLKYNKGRANIDFQKLAQKLVGNRRLLRVYYYTATVDQFSVPQLFKEQQKFLTKLYHLPYFEVRLGYIKTYGEGKDEKDWVEKGVDVKLAVDMLKLASTDAYDTAILVSHDGDFAYVVSAVKEMGKHVENACFMDPRCKSRCSDNLIKVSDKPISLDGDFLDDCWLPEKEARD